MDRYVGVYCGRPAWRTASPMTAPASLRSRSSAATSCRSNTASPVRRFRHCLLKTLNSISGHVQPASMPGSVVKLQALSYTTRFGCSKCFVERAQLVGIEIVQHQPDDPGLGVGLVNQPAHLVREVHRSATLGHFDVSPSALRFTEHEPVSGTVFVGTRSRSVPPVPAWL